MDFHTGGAIFSQISDPISEERSAFYISQIVLAFEFLHQHQIFGLKTTPERILMDNEGYLKLNITTSIPEDSNELNLFNLEFPIIL